MDRRDEPPTPPDWREAPAEVAATDPPLGVASEFDRALGLAVHAALRRWQRGVDGGQAPKGQTLVDAVRREAAAGKLDRDRLDRALTDLGPRLVAYAEGPWPRRRTLFLEQPLRHRLVAPDGFRLDLRLRVDRVVRYQRQVAILDFKSVSPHTAELRADEWQLRTYAMAAPELLGVAADNVKLFLVDIRKGLEREVECSSVTLAAARNELLASARGIAAGAFGVDAYPQRPCWSCGFRLECPESLARRAPVRRLDFGVPQWEVVEDMRRVPPGKAGTLIPSWNTGFELRAAPDAGAAAAGLVRPGQKLRVLEERAGHLRVHQEADGLEGWIPTHVVAPWPEP